MKVEKRINERLYLIDYQSKVKFLSLIILKHSIDKKNTRYIPTQIKRFIWNRDQGKCQFRDSKTNHQST